VEAGADLKAMTKDGQCCQHLACQSGELATARYLINQKCDFTVRTGGKGWTTPLYMAAMYGHLQIVQLLVESGVIIT